MTQKEFQKKSLDTFKMFEKKFESIDSFQNEVLKKFDAIDERFEAIDQRFENLENKFDRFEVQLKMTREDVAILKEKVTVIEHEAATKTDIETLLKTNSEEYLRKTYGARVTKAEADIEMLKTKI